MSSSRPRRSIWRGLFSHRSGSSARAMALPMPASRGLRRSSTASSLAAPAERHDAGGDRARRERSAAPWRSARRRAAARQRALCRVRLDRADRPRHEVILTHGNGPQIGLPALQATAYRALAPYPLDVLGAESEGMIGCMIEQALAGDLPGRNLATLLTQVEVDPADPAFLAPSKPIGPVTPRRRRSGSPPIPPGYFTPIPAAIAASYRRPRRAGSSKSPPSSCWRGPAPSSSAPAAAEFRSSPRPTADGAASRR